MGVNQEKREKKWWRGRETRQRFLPYTEIIECVKIFRRETNGLPYGTPCSFCKSAERRGRRLLL